MPESHRLYASKPYPNRDMGWMPKVDRMILLVLVIPTPTLLIAPVEHLPAVHGRCPAHSIILQLTFRISMR